jgi:glucokinase
MITDAAMQGDPCAVELLDDLGRWLGEGLASLATIFDPTLVVIGSPRRFEPACRHFPV